MNFIFDFYSYAHEFSLLNIVQNKGKNTITVTSEV